MPRRSTIQKLDPRLKVAVDDALRDGRATIDQIVERIRGMGADVSRSAIGRYKQTFEERLGRFKEAQEVAGAWVRQMRADPDGDVGRLLAEMLKVIAFQTQSELAEGGADAKQVALLARAVKDLASVDKLKTEIEHKMQATLRGQVREAVDAAVAGAATAIGGGRTPEEALRRIREDVYGIFA